MTPEAEQRLAQVTPLYSALGGMWPLLAAELERSKADLVISLISENSEELRGRIKQIDDLLNLPHSLRQELDLLTKPLPGEDGLV